MSLKYNALLNTLILSGPNKYLTRPDLYSLKLKIDTENAEGSQLEMNNWCRVKVIIVTTL